MNCDPFNPQQVQDRIVAIRAAAKQLTDTYKGDAHVDLQMTGHVAELSVALSERAENAGARVICLTRVLVVLTVALLIATVVLCLYTYELIKYENLSHQQTVQTPTQPPKPTP